MTLFQLDAIKTLENAVQFSMKLDLFVIIYVSMSVPSPIIHLKYNTDINYDAYWIHHKTILCYAKVQCQGR